MKMERIQSRDAKATGDGARNWQILLVEDNQADVRLTQEALKELRINHRLQVAGDGLAAVDYLTNMLDNAAFTRPDIIILDLNLPRMNGLEVLAIIKSNNAFKAIPVIVMSSSTSDTDVSSAYKLNANCYTIKPLEIDQFISVMESIRRFWFETVVLPDCPAGKFH
jgi:CheY-like chemotaxis protein